ncbi:hypothetical protein GCM10027280_61820 [Micromonospora polyrhachis]|uniref:Putative Flp pilus-assembly TadG-like N-terminal domain-containing protein n=2 Tax=Micromonospora polyrhachis TaxID=1282883 RepID=A0A7W7WPH4_9ACTN|nr:hypothetical protein [Micromonospora polyrhachis]
MSGRRHSIDMLGEHRWWGEHRDAGRVSLFLAVALTGVLVIIGLAFDGTGQLRSMQRADNLAAEAARTGGQAIDRASAIAGRPKVVDEEQARAAIRNYLAGLAGVRDWSVRFDSGQQLTVTVDVEYDTYLLDLFGFKDKILVRGEATAHLRTDP